MPRGRRRYQEVARRRFRRLRKELRLDESEGRLSDAGPPHRVDITSVPARTGYLHPLGLAELRRALDFFGPVAKYGLRSVELRHAPRRYSRGLPLATLQVPGKVVLYEQANPPWTIRGLTQPSIERLRRAGASIEEGPAATRVDWTSEALRDFMLFDGLMHEIGHHLIQQHTGKRAARVMRTADHERRASAFADACRVAWEEAKRRD